MNLSTMIDFEINDEKALKDWLDSLYRKYNDKEYIQYDPVKYVHVFERPEDMEVAGLISSSLAFGRVSHIFKALDIIFSLMGESPFEYVMGLNGMPHELINFKYRFIKGPDIYNFLCITKDIIKEHGSLYKLFYKCYIANKKNFLDAVSDFILAYKEIRFLIPATLKSPCKRLFMYLRWMIRSDEIDLGIWDFVSVSQLLIPVDTHILQMARRLNLTSRRNASLKTAIEITERLRKFSPDDPVKYDWPLSHMGIIKNLKNDMVKEKI